MPVAPLPVNTLLKQEQGEYRYRVDAFLGGGGFGITYRATDLKLQGPVVIKELAFDQVSFRDVQHSTLNALPGKEPTHGKLVSRFAEEAQKLNRFRNPHIVRVLDVWRERGTAYYAMDLVRASRHIGEPPSGWEPAHGPPPTFPWHSAQRWGEQLLTALRDLHDVSMVHGDIKPDNVLIDERDNIVLIDFGTARTEQDLARTVTSQAYTPGYAAPELEARSRVRESGPWSDLYGWGMIMYGLCCPHQGYEYSPIEATTRVHMSAQGKDAYADAANQLISAGVPPNWAQAIGWCLRLDPQARPQSVVQMLDWIAQQGTPTQPQPKNDRLSQSGSTVLEGANTSSVGSTVFEDANSSSPGSTVFEDASTSGVSAGSTVFEDTSSGTTRGGRGPSTGNRGNNPLDRAPVTVTSSSGGGGAGKIVLALVAGAAAAGLAFVLLGTDLILGGGDGSGSGAGSGDEVAEADTGPDDDDGSDAEIEEAGSGGGAGTQGTAPDLQEQAPVARLFLGSACDGSVPCSNGAECTQGRCAPSGMVHVPANETVDGPFFIAVNEVTQQEFESLMSTNPSYFAGCGPNCPVERVSWFEAITYANALSESQGLPQCYDMDDCEGTAGSGCDPERFMCEGDYECDEVDFEDDCSGYRLPTREEWELAAALSHPPATLSQDPVDERNHPGFEPIAWYAGNSGVTYEGGFDCSTWTGRSTESATCGTNPVGGRTAGELGAADMYGNVSEWIHDMRGERLQMGGSWGSAIEDGTLEGAGEWDPELRNFSIGIRLVRSVPGPPSPPE